MAIPEMKIVFVCFGVAVLQMAQATFTQMAPNDDIWNKMSAVQNISQWCQLLNIDDCERVINSLPTSMVDETGKELDIVGKENVPVAVFDSCTPRFQTVMIPERPGYMVWPPCTRAMRCAGCCTNAMKSCQPTTLSEKQVKVYYTKHPGHRMRISRAQPKIEASIVKIIEHVGCMPACKIKEEDCKKYQKYDPNSCRCVCRPDRRILISTCRGKHIWDEETCSCICSNRKTTICPSTAFFSPAACKCKLKSDADRETYSEQFSDMLEHDGKAIDVNIVAENIVVFGEMAHKENGINKETGRGRSRNAGGDDDDDANSTAEELQTPTVASDPCFDTKCAGNLKARRLRSGKCQCLPDFRRNVLIFDQQNP